MAHVWVGPRDQEWKVDEDTGEIIAGPSPSVAEYAAMRRLKKARDQIKAWEADAAIYSKVLLRLIEKTTFNDDLVAYRIESSSSKTDWKAAELELPGINAVKQKYTTKTPYEYIRVATIKEQSDGPRSTESDDW